MEKLPPLLMTYRTGDAIIALWTTLYFEKRMRAISQTLSERQNQRRPKKQTRTSEGVSLNRLANISHGKHLPDTQVSALYSLRSAEVMAAAE